MSHLRTLDIVMQELIRANMKNEFLSFEKQYKTSENALSNLFGNAEIVDRMGRLEDIYTKCEQAWRDNVCNRLSGKPVQYLLLAEAAPWSEPNATVEYFYINPKGSWVGRIMNAFGLTEVPVSKRLDELAKKGFLLVDTIPFAMKYKSNHRRKDSYRELMESCRPWVEHHLKCKDLKWSNDLKVAIAFNLNGQRVIETYGKLRYGKDRGKELLDIMIAVDGSNYTSATRLKEIFHLTDI